MVKKLLLGIITLFSVIGFAGVAWALPYYQQSQSIIPGQNDKYNLGTSSPSLLEYNNIFTKNITISGSCTGCTSGSALTKGYFIVGNDTGAEQATSSIFISSAGNIGIGTTSSTYQLNIATSTDSTTFSTIQNLTVTSPSSGFTDLFQFAAGAKTNRGGSIYFGETGNGTAFNAIQEGIDFTLNNLQIFQKGNFPISFYTNATESGGSVSSAPQLTILGNGNVGIGTTSPIGALHIKTTSDNALTVDQTLGNTFLLWANNSTQMAAQNLAASTGDFQQFVRTSGGTWIEALRAQRSTGYIGINQTSPAGPLDIGITAGTPAIIADTTSGRSIGPNNLLFLQRSGSNNYAEIRMQSGNATFDWGINQSVGAYFFNNGNSRVYFGSNGIERMSLSATGGLSLGTATWNTTNPGAGNLNIQGNVGIGTSTPVGALSVQSSSNTVFVAATSSGNEIGGYDGDGHKFTAGPPPAITSCGTGTGTVVGDDQSGTITTATAATACTATFSKAYAKTPSCTVTDNSLVGFADISSVSTTAVTFGISSALTGGLLYYSCQYHR